MLILSGHVDLEITREIKSPNNNTSMSQRGADLICKLEMRPKFGLVSIEYFGGANGAN